MENFISSYSILSKTEGFIDERNDCVVKAMAVSYNINYGDAYTLVKNVMFRQRGRGTTLTNMVSYFNKSVNWETIGYTGKKMCRFYAKYKKSGLHSTVYLKDTVFDDRQPFIVKYNKRTSEVSIKSYTVKSFRETYNKGTYLVLVSGHAFVIKDGTIIGNKSDGIRLRRPIQRAFKYFG